MLTRAVISVCACSFLLLSAVLGQEELFSGCNTDVYYKDLIGNSSWTRADIGKLLKATHRRTLPYTATGRDDVWDALQDLDRSTESHTTDDGVPLVNLIYTNTNVSAVDYGTAPTWNREHLWPKSHGVGTSGSDFTDVHHLRASDWNVNSARSNLYFGECGLENPIEECTIPATTEAANDTSKDRSVFSPPTYRKGDIARALFYMELRYFGDGNDPDLKLTDCPYDNNGSSSQMAYLSQLLLWHKSDPVADEERARNDRACERWQGNRNIFVDYPNLVEEIFGEAQVANGPFGYPFCNVTSPPPKNENGNEDENENEDGNEDENQTNDPLLASECSDLSPGDIQIITLNSDNPDVVTLVTLEELPGGMELYMTDNAWKGNSFMTNEGSLVLRVPDDGFPPGMIFGHGDSQPFKTYWNSKAGTFALSASGDTVIVYCLKGDNVVHHLAAISVSGEWSETGQTTYDSSKSALPESLTGLAPTLPHFDNYVYRGITEGTKPTIQKAIVDVRNWNGSNSEQFSFQGPSSFTITDSGAGNTVKISDSNTESTANDTGTSDTTEANIINISNTAEDTGNSEGNTSGQVYVSTILSCIIALVGVLS